MIALNGRLSFWQEISWWLQKRMAPNMPDYDVWCCKINPGNTGRNNSSDKSKPTLKLKKKSA